MALTPGEAAALITALGGFVFGAWQAVGKGRESAQAREDRVRTELRAVEKERDDMQDELSQTRHRLNTLVEFLRDVVDGDYTPEWVKKRAAGLLKRVQP